MLQITKDRSGSNVEVKLGESFEVELSENPTTGYRWQLLSTGGSVIEPEDDSYQPLGGNSPGGGGIRRWRFRTLKEGVVDVEMEYRRSWEKQPAQTFRV